MSSQITFGGFIQDDWRVNAKLTVNYGLRLEHERGLSEENNNFTVGWDPKMTSVLSSITIPADPLSGTPARAVSGGLMYAGVDGNKTYQGNAPNLKWSPRVGAAYALDTEDRHPRRVRPVLGAIELRRFQARPATTTARSATHRTPSSRAAEATRLR